ncbi:rano class II histocompatibility antigen, A beta chain-like [Heterodontus francisci]|uniref:rano class II histocompatibility antigen, A beta chain-like n=1 Tax=Heterodontus francisci TaxID=7792 RepID=UPI00355C5131
MSGGAANRLDIRGFILLSWGLTDTLGIHLIQLLFSCDGPHPWVSSLRFAYDGEDYIKFNYTTDKFVAANPLAQPFVDSFNSDAKMVRKYVRYGYYGTLVAEAVLQVAQTLTAKPSIAITAHRLSGGNGHLLLNCRIGGFYPRAINTTWLQDGGAVEQEVLKSRILPNKDGTFQVTLRISIDPGRGDSYTCQVEHRSAPEKLTAVWVPKRKNVLLTHGKVIGLILMVVGVIIAAIGAFIGWKGRHASGSQPGPNQGQANTHLDAYGCSTNSGVCSQAEHLCEEIEWSPSPTPAESEPSNSEGPPIFGGEVASVYVLAGLDESDSCRCSASRVEPLAL